VVWGAAETFVVSGREWDEERKRSLAIPQILVRLQKCGVGKLFGMKMDKGHRSSTQHC
jgi:hypothetical protein